MMAAVESTKKRIRTSNFTINEKNLIVNLASKYKNIIENKETNVASCADTNKAWDQIAAELNASSLNVTPRSVQSIKTWYKNRKKTVRQLAADERLSLNRTGGGPPKPSKKESYDDLLLSIMNKKTVHGMYQAFDSDASSSLAAENQPSSQMEWYNFPTDFEDGQERISDDIIDLDEEVPQTSRSIHIEEVPQTSTNICIEEVPQTSSRILLEGVAERNVQPEEIPVQTNPVRRRFVASRRRPATVVKALTTSDLAEKYSRLVERRLEIAEYQKQILENANQEHEANMKLLNLKIQVEEAKLQNALSK